MSHNISMTNVLFKDMATLGAIVKEMSGGKATLDMSAKSFRTFAGQPTDCDAAIKMPGKHDIGLKNNGKGAHTPVFDPYDMDPIFKAQGGRSYIGALAREYALQEAEYEAAQQGYTTERVEGAKGVITLEILAS